MMCVLNIICEHYKNTKLKSTIFNRKLTDLLNSDIYIYIYSEIAYFKNFYMRNYKDMKISVI